MQQQLQYPAAVLVVEDEILLRMCATEALNDEGLPTLEADAASNALSILESHPEVKVVFTDINIQGAMNGLQLAQEIARRHPDVQVVITSGRRRPATSEMPDGALFVPKPYPLETVAGLVGQLCKRQPSLPH